MEDEHSRPSTVDNSTQLLHTSISPYLNRSKFTSDMLENHHDRYSLTAVVAIGGLFMLFTSGIISALVVFLRKRNAVFVFQQTEQEDYDDCEVEDPNTDTEFADTDMDCDHECQIANERTSKGDFCQNKF